jgi:hypothetical protein
MKSLFFSLMNKQTFSRPKKDSETAYEAFTDHTNDYSVRTAAVNYNSFIQRYPEAFRDVRNLFRSEAPDTTYSPKDWF